MDSDKGEIDRRDKAMKSHLRSNSVGGGGDTPRLVHASTQIQTLI